MAHKSRTRVSKKTSRRASRKRTPPNAPSTAIVRVSPAPERPWELNDEAITILKNSIAKGASDEELKYCLTVARRYKLDPFKQQIWFIKRWDRNADDGAGSKGAHIWTPQVGIYGLLHIAARDHKDYGGMSEPEYGPMITIDVEGKKIKGPEWARVKVWKKGNPHPTVGEAYFEEYCPKRWENTLFWRTMPRRMIAKCAKAQGAREACPDLGGLYIPEETARMQEDYTPDGRQIVRQDGTAPSGQPVTWEAQKRLNVEADSAQAVAGLMEKGLWCMEHQCPISTNHLKVCEASRKAQGLGAAKPTEERKPPQASGVSPSTAPAVPPAQKAEPWKFAGCVTIDHTKEPPIVTGDMEPLVASMPKDLNLSWGQDEFYHIALADLDKLRQACVKLNFEIREIRPAKSSAPQRHESGKTTAKRGSGGGDTAAPTVVMAGTIERTNMGMAGKAPVKYVTLLMAGKKKAFLGCFHKSMWDDIEAGLGKLAAFVVVEKGEYKNIEKIRQIGSKEWDESGTPVIQRKDQEAGQKTLY